MISFSLIPTTLRDGQVEIVLRLYRPDGSLASTTPVATVERGAAAMVLMKCRVHLRTRGIHEVAEGLRPAG